MEMKTRYKTGLKTGKVVKIGYKRKRDKRGQENKTEVWLQKGKNFQGLLVGDRLYIEESQYTPRTPHETLATYTGEGYEG